MVRPKLEYCVQACRTYLKKDIENIERVQHRATKMILGYGKMSYENRIKSLGLPTLEQRRERGDLIEVFKLINRLENVDYRQFFELDTKCRTRGHKFKITKERSRLDIRLNFFSQRIVNIWNSLPYYVVEADSLNTFKNRLDKHRYRN